MTVENYLKLVFKFSAFTVFHGNLTYSTKFFDKTHKRSFWFVC